MNYKKDWEDKKYKEYQNCDLNEVQQLLKEAYAKAIADKDGKHQYTHLVIFNLRMLAKYGIDKMTFNQWKSFRAYTSITNEIIKDEEIQTLWNNDIKPKTTLEILIENKKTK
jgi:hypothetical protein